MTVAAYLRVSSASQTAAMQRDAIDRCARARGDVVERWYSDTFTGGKLERPELVRLRTDARAGDLRKLYVYRLDRLTRTGIRDTFDLVEEFRRFGAELVTVADGFDFQGPAAEIVLAVLAWAAKMERHAINERISAARVHVEAKGGKWGRPRRVDSQLAEKASEMRRAGHSLRYISQACKVPRATVARCLKNIVPKDGLRGAKKTGLSKARGGDKPGPSQ